MKTYPAVNLELLVQDGLLEGSGLGARCRGGKTARRVLEHACASGDEGLHARLCGSAMKETKETRERGGGDERGDGRGEEGTCDCTLWLAPPSLPRVRQLCPGFVGRIPPTQSRAVNFRPRTDLHRDAGPGAERRPIRVKAASFWSRLYDILADEVSLET